MTLRSAWIAISLVVVACGGAPPQPEAPSGPESPRFAVLEERWATERPPDWEPIAEATFRRALHGARVEVVSGAPLLSAIENAPAECDDDVECLRGIARTLHVDQLVTTTIAELGGTVLIRVRVVGTDEGSADAMQQAVVRDAGRRATAAALFAIGSELAAPYLPPSAPEDDLDWYASPWFWAGTGTAVALGAAVVIVLVVSQTGQDPDVIIDP